MPLTIANLSRFNVNIRQQASVFTIGIVSLKMGAFGGNQQRKLWQCGGNR
jgi:hypothetical protein